MYNEALLKLLEIGDENSVLTRTKYKRNGQYIWKCTNGNCYLWNPITNEYEKTTELERDLSMIKFTDLFDILGDGFYDVYGFADEYVTSFAINSLEDEISIDTVYSQELLNSEVIMLDDNDIYLDI